MKSDFNILADAADDDGLDNHRNAPRLILPACMDWWATWPAQAATPPKPTPTPSQQISLPSWVAPWDVGRTCPSATLGTTHACSCCILVARAVVARVMRLL